MRIPIIKWFKRLVSSRKLFISNVLFCFSMTIRALNSNFVFCLSFLSITIHPDDKGYTKTAPRFAITIATEVSYFHVHFYYFSPNYIILTFQLSEVYYILLFPSRHPLNLYPRLPLFINTRHKTSAFNDLQQLKCAI